LNSPDASPLGFSQAWLEWLGSPPGQYALAWQQLQYDRVVPDLFGFHALQCALPGLNPLRLNRMPHRVTAYLPGEWTEHTRALMTPSLGAESQVVNESRVIGGAQPDVLLLDAFEELPIASESVDLMILPHVLEFAHDPHQVLREVDRVLRPEGRVFVSGFNPVSIWGARQVCLRSLPERITRPYLPGEGQFISVPRLKDWFKLLSFEMGPTQFGCFAPPFRSQKWLDRWRFMETAGDKFWPICGAVYFASAVKRVGGMRLIGPAWRGKPVRSRKAVVVGSVNSGSINSGSVHSGAVESQQLNHKTSKSSKVG
jgi:SAM-dependent methyltransferase